MIKAIIFDLDGVITKTASVHAKAWKRVFDAYLEYRRETGKSTFEPFELMTDYHNTVDGKPRYDGVRHFLKTRSIVIPEGKPADSPGWDSVCGIGNQKNIFFQTLLERNGVEVFPDVLGKVVTWKNQGFHTAVVSSSKNCEHVLKSARIELLFDVRVDGVIAEKQKLSGKPAPDIFLRAAKEMGVKPENAAVFEDAKSGVQAGKAGGFGLVAGVARKKNQKELLKNGAHVSIRSFDDINIGESGRYRVNSNALPSALEKLSIIKNKIFEKSVAVFLDYDGTLTPIVNKPEEAFLSERMRSILKRLAEYVPVAIVSGRDLKTIQSFVNLKKLIYAGSHGFDIQMPDGKTMQYKKAKKALESLKKAEEKLNDQAVKIPGASIERKRFAIAVHYRNVQESDVKDLLNIVDSVLSEYSDLRRSPGKKVVEMQPDIDWHKGRAVLWLLEELGMNQSETMPLYIGDDVTDEDAFLALQNSGTGILVGSHGKHTAASYRLENVEETAEFLKTLIG